MSGKQSKMDRKMISHSDSHSRSRSHSRSFSRSRSHSRIIISHKYQSSSLTDNFLKYTGRPIKIVFQNVRNDITFDDIIDSIDIQYGFKGNFFSTIHHNYIMNLDYTDGTVLIQDSPIKVLDTKIVCLYNIHLIYLCITILNKKRMWNDISILTGNSIISRYGLVIFRKEPNQKILNDYSKNMEVYIILI